METLDTLIKRMNRTEVCMGFTGWRPGTGMLFFQVIVWSLDTFYAPFTITAFFIFREEVWFGTLFLLYEAICSTLVYIFSSYVLSYLKIGLNFSWLAMELLACLVFIR